MFSNTAVGTSTFGNLPGACSQLSKHRTHTEPSARVHRIFDPAPQEGPNPLSTRGRIRIREQPNSSVGEACKSGLLARRVLCAT
jgi:hypothetical protein